MGVVYRAKDTRLDPTIALKFLSQELTLDIDAKKRFIQEAKAAAESEISRYNCCGPFPLYHFTPFTTIYILFVSYRFDGVFEGGFNCL